ncbi:MAG: CvpA family protein [Alistipes sp.]|nr:CvpA family protein [Alistipes sp.]MBQ9138974.1 CvpA family protein [Alistipes sp.]
MNVFDIITLIFLVLAIFNGWRKGFISQLCSLAGIVGGIALAIAFGESVGAMLGIDAAYSKVLGFIITFIAASIATSLLAKILSSLFSAIGLGGLDTLLGMALSALKYGLILSVLFVAFENLNKDMKLVEQRHFTESKSFEPVSALSETALEWFNTFTKEVEQ